MTLAASQVIAVTRVIEDVMRQDRGRLMAALIARLRDFQLAEDALQDAAISAISHWGRSGLPSSPHGWLLRVAFLKAIDRLRLAGREDRKAMDQAIFARDEAEVDDIHPIQDDRLRLIFTCCHPALDPKSRVALTLRTLCGLSTPKVAAVFLDAETTKGQRLSRAKAKILAARIPFAIPGPEDLPARLNSVLTVVYLIFTPGSPPCERHGHEKKGRAFARPSPTGRFEGTRARSSFLRVFR
jgi:predicted RNA polymerase sigma factor